MSAKLVLDGVEHVVADLPVEIRDLISVYNTWSDELKKAKVEVFKLEAAQRGLTQEIEQRVRKLSAKT